jgi:hypothetical protein
VELQEDIQFLVVLALLEEEILFLTQVDQKDQTKLLHQAEVQIFLILLLIIDQEDLEQVLQVGVQYQQELVILPHLARLKEIQGDFQEEQQVQLEVEELDNQVSMEELLVRLVETVVAVLQLIFQELQHITVEEEDLEVITEDIVLKMELVELVEGAQDQEVQAQLTLAVEELEEDSKVLLVVVVDQVE